MVYRLYSRLWVWRFSLAGHGFLRQAGVAGRHGDQLLVVELDAQRVGHVLGNEAPARAVLPAKSD